MHALRIFVVVGLMATAGWMPTRAAERVDLILVLAADVSGSMEESPSPRPATARRSKPAGEGFGTS